MLIKLFFTFLKIGAFSFGGGYGVLTFMQKELIDVNGWISLKEFTDIVAIAQITPGAIAVNASTFIGFKLGGIPGSIITTIAVILVPFILSLLVSIYYNKFKHLKQVNSILKGIRPAVLGLIAAACIKIATISIVDIKSVLIAVLVFVSLYKFKINPIICLAGSGVLGLILYGLM